MRVGACCTGAGSDEHQHARLVALRANGTLAGLFSRQALTAGIEVVDVRLLTIRDRIYTLGTYPARGYASAVAPLRVRRRAGLRELLAWQLPGEMLHLRRGACRQSNTAFAPHRIAPSHRTASHRVSPNH